MIFKKKDFEGLKVPVTPGTMALRLPEFRSFLIDIIKMKPEDVETLGDCKSNNCLDNLKFPKNVTKMVNDFIFSLDKQNKLDKFRPKPNMFLKKGFGRNYQEAIDFILENKDLDYADLMIGFKEKK